MSFSKFSRGHQGGGHPRRQRIQLPLRHRDRGARVSPEMSAINLD